MRLYGIVYSTLKVILPKSLARPSPCAVFTLTSSVATVPQSKLLHQLLTLPVYGSSLPYCSYVPVLLCLYKL